MKKVIIVLLVLIAVTAIGLPPVIGGMTESSVRAHIAQMDENPMFAMQVSDYERGWFSSQAQVRIAFDERYLELAAADAGDIAAGADQGITVPVRIAHGPVVVTDGLYFGMSRIYAVLGDSDPLVAMATQELGLDHLAELSGQVSYFGTFDFTGSMPPIEYIGETGQISFSGLHLDGTARGPDLQLDGRMEDLAMDAAGTAVTIENLDVASDSTRINQLLWAGEFDGGIESMTIVDTLAGADGAIELTGLQLDGRVDLDDTGELFDASASYTAESVRLPGEDMLLSDAELGIGITNLSVEALTEYYETAMDIDPRNPAPAAILLPGIGARLLAANPAVSIDPIRFTLDGSSLNAAISLRTVNGDQSDIDLSNPMMLLGMFEASARIAASKPLFEMLAGQAAAAQLGAVDPAQLPPNQDIESLAAGQASVMIISLLGQGYLVDDGENYSTEIEYANGEVLINGMPLPLGALLQ
ncbi:MAG: YdgA family protein [Gammaproteobacteria bacterium]|jgi:uncharacterized protein YdgA (DUF945 family)